MVYHSVVSPWAVSQKKSLQFYFNTEFRMQAAFAKGIDKIALNLRPVGTTILVEWEE